MQRGSLDLLSEEYSSQDNQLSSFEADYGL